MKIVVCYAHEDVEIVKQIVDGLEKKSLLVWWDKEMSFDEAFQNRIADELHNSGCILVVWSSHSNKTEWVTAEANRAYRLGKPIVQVCIGDAEPPLPFNARQFQPLSVAPGNRVESSDLATIVQHCRDAIGVKGPKEILLDARATKRGWDFDARAIETPVPGMDILLSFRPCGANGVFLLMREDSTNGWVNENIPTARERHAVLTMVEPNALPRSYQDADTRYVKVKNDVLFIMDPLRPYGIQIGGLRSARPNATPGTISGDISPDQLRMLPRPEGNVWLYLTLAEILTRGETLEKLHDLAGSDHGFDAHTSKQIRELIAKNPYAPLELQESMCLFCKPAFKQHRVLTTDADEREHGAFIVANDFPFGPSFHYLAITTESIHSWERLTYRHVQGINLLLWKFLRNSDNTKGAAGISFGFNSTVRHLVLGSKTHSSAGASIQHIHKQAWGMPSNGANIAERLIEVSQAYWNHRVDYQQAYHDALDEAGYIIWQDPLVSLYVPYGQSSKGELQAMLRSPRGNITELTESEIVSLSKAEYVVLRIFKKLGINSFNQVVLSKLLHETRAPMFHLVVAFITREVDLAVSELSMLFVVDQHPWDSRNEIAQVWKDLRAEVEEEIGEALARSPERGRS